MSAVEQKMDEYKAMLGQYGLEEGNEKHGYMVAGFVDGFRGGFQASSEAVVAALDAITLKHDDYMYVGDVIAEIEALSTAIHTGRVPE